jgi:hypothetical protein
MDEFYCKVWPWRLASRANPTSKEKGNEGLTLKCRWIQEIKAGVSVRRHAIMISSEIIVRSSACVTTVERLRCDIVIQIRIIHMHFAMEAGWKTIT